MGVNTVRMKTRISVVDTLPTYSEIGEIVYLRSDDKIYVRTVAGWMSTAALT